MSENKILIPAILNSYRPLRDKSWSINLNINEPTAEQKVIIDRLYQEAVFVMIKSSEINQEEQFMIGELVITSKVKTQSKSKILRDKIWKYWKNNFEDKISSEEFYEQQMDKLIDHFDKK